MRVLNADAPGLGSETCDSAGLKYIDFERVTSRRYLKPRMALALGSLDLLIGLERNTIELVLRGVLGEPSRGIRRNAHMPRRRLTLDRPVRMNGPIGRLVIECNGSQPCIEDRVQHDRVEACIQRRRVHARREPIDP